MNRVNLPADKRRNEELKAKINQAERTCPRCGGKPIFLVLTKADGRERLRCHICEYKYWADDPQKRKSK
jgi:ribosomal protein S27AE